VAWWRHNCETSHVRKVFLISVGYEQCSTLFSTITMVIFDRFDNFSTIGNRNEYFTKHVQTVSLQPNSAYKTKNSTKQTTAYAVHSAEPIVPDFCRKSFNVRFFPCLLQNFFSSLLTKNLLYSHGFYQKLSSNSIRVILTCKLLSWLVTWSSY